MKIHKLNCIKTPNLIIRPIKLGDEIQINEAVNHSLDALQRWMPWAKDPSLEVTKVFVEHAVSCSENDSSNEFPMTIIDKVSDKIISVSGYNDRSKPQESLYEIGYWIDS
ncbi:GNAT family N-acetyltransferase [Thiotrichales bacterium 19S9-12]|nr:GNAT family N-acetyltransferase [Thiotrichales bacterium 19S9-11]MCF6812047.1 GNAT family N-acetyltransferase [Thiotrichales bacterium 19S9-12]